MGVSGPGPTHPCLAEDKSDKGTLRPAKSMDSLSAGAGASDGECLCTVGTGCGVAMRLLASACGTTCVRVSLRDNSVMNKTIVCMHLCVCTHSFQK